MNTENVVEVQEEKELPVEEIEKKETGEKVTDEKEPVKEKKEPVKKATTKKAAKPQDAINEELAVANKTVADLTEQLKAHQEQLINYDTVKKSLEETEKKVEQAENKVKEYEDLLNKMIEEKMKKVPSEFAELVPSNMSITQQLDWLVKAESKNLFNTSNKNLDVEIGKPMGATVNDTKANIKDMNSSSLLSMAYNIMKK